MLTAPSIISKYELTFSQVALCQPKSRIFFAAVRPNSVLEISETHVASSGLGYNTLTAPGALVPNVNNPCSTFAFVLLGSLRFFKLNQITKTLLRLATIRAVKRAS